MMVGRASERTPEQVAADEALTAAIANCIKAYDYLQPGFVSTEFIVLVNQVGWDDEGDQNTALITLYRNGGMPWMAIIGLLRMGVLRAEAEFNSSGATD